MSQSQLHPEILAIDCEVEADRIARRMVEIVGRELRRRGVVIALSGGVTALSARLSPSALSALPKSMA